MQKASSCIPYVVSPSDQPLIHPLSNPEPSTGRTPLIACAERDRVEWLLPEDERYPVRRFSGGGNGSGGSSREEEDGEEEKKQQKQSDEDVIAAGTSDELEHFGAQVAHCLLQTSSTLIDAR